MALLPPGCPTLCCISRQSGKPYASASVPIFLGLIVREGVAESQPLMLPYTWSRSFKDLAQAADRFEPHDENTVR
jgi:hypothetical protein